MSKRSELCAPGGSLTARRAIDWSYALREFEAQTASCASMCDEYSSVMAEASLEAQIHTSGSLDGAEKNMSPSANVSTIEQTGTKHSNNKAYAGVYDFLSRSLIDNEATPLVSATSERKTKLTVRELSILNELVSGLYKQLASVDTTEAIAFVQERRDMMAKHTAMPTHRSNSSCSKESTTDASHERNDSVTQGIGRSEDISRKNLLEDVGMSTNNTNTTSESASEQRKDTKPLRFNPLSITADVLNVLLTEMT
eukprot:CFRG6328T1